MAHDPHTDSGKVNVDPNEPASDYYAHDQGTTGVVGPGPFAGDFGAPIPYTDANPYGDLPESYVYPPDNYKDGPYDLAQLKRDAVNVRIVDEVPKTRTVRYQTLTMTIAAGESQQILGRDPTRIRALIQVTTAAMVLWISPTDINNTFTAFQLPAPGAGPIELLSEDAIYGYGDTANSGNVTVTILAEYVRSDNSRAETYNPA